MMGEFYLLIIPKFGLLGSNLIAASKKGKGDQSVKQK